MKSYTGSITLNVFVNRCFFSPRNNGNEKRTVDIIKLDEI